MAPITDVDADLKYLLLVIKNADFKPNYQALATEAGVNNANNASVLDSSICQFANYGHSQKRFKKLVENGGFELVKGVVVSPGGSADSVTTGTPAKPKGKRAGTPGSKKRKVQETEEDEEGEVKEDSKSAEE
jgi:hypothetical protein